MNYDCRSKISIAIKHLPLVKTCSNLIKLVISEKRETWTSCLCFYLTTVINTTSLIKHNCRRWHTNCATTIWGWHEIYMVTWTMSTSLHKLEILPAKGISRSGVLNKVWYCVLNVLNNSVHINDSIIWSPRVRFAVGVGADWTPQLSDWPPQFFRLADV